LDEYRARVDDESAREHLPPLVEGNTAPYEGLAGRVVRTLLPYTESAPEAMLFTFLAMFGNAVGRGPYLWQEGVHNARLYVAVVGPTSTGRKGTSFRNVKRLFQEACPDWTSASIVSGASSGEGLADLISNAAG